MKFKDLPIGSWIWDSTEKAIWIKISSLLTEDSEKNVNAICIMAPDMTEEYDCYPGQWSSYNEEAEVELFEQLELVEESVYK